MPRPRFILQVSGRQSPGDLAGLGAADGGVTTSTVLLVGVRDQAALQGLLRRIHDLGLNLVDLHEAYEGDRGTASGRHVLVTVDGPVGELVETTLQDHIGPMRVSSRSAFADAAVMGEVLTRLLARGAELEHASEQSTAAPLP